MEPIHIEGFLSFTFAITLLFIGKYVTLKSTVLQKYSIPEPVIGGFICAAIVAIIFYVMGSEVIFDLTMRDYLLLYFFAGIGLNADFRTLISGGKPLFILISLAVAYIVLQNIVGLSAASLFGLDPLIGLMSGSISLIGGVGTTMAWAPTYAEMGIESAAEIGIASNTLGLIAACLIGGPIAKYLMSRHKLKASGEEELDLGVFHNENIKLDYFGLLFAWLMLNLCLILGYFIDIAIAQTGLQLPMFVSCLIAGILIGNFKTLILKKPLNRNAQLGLNLISDISLSLFLTMALMGMQL